MHQASSAQATLALAVICLAVLVGASDAQYCGCRSHYHEALFKRRRDANAETPAHGRLKNFIKVDDMLIPREDFELALTSQTSHEGARQQADGYVKCRRLWPNGKLFYTFANDYPSDTKEAIRRALRTLSSWTNGTVEFVESDNENKPILEGVRIINGDGCWSHVGRHFRDQELSLGEGCVHDYIVQHEFMHALGLGHEQSRSDRDKFVRIMWHRIEADKCSNFYKNRRRVPRNFPAYDYQSVMHYPSHAFGCRGRNTIVRRNGSVILDNEAVTDLDIAKIMYLYSPDNLTSCSSKHSPGGFRAFDGASF